ncbi:DUF547 domain-containing protein [Rufibacter tibetensis]|uniref:DUF547 domain-containing protein n=1 Tax=Rufibacter tibetensis TaxID=512763 RepID=A0A0P0C6H2_9BACT|nr:DUF547 domain-containing protein [Rufibacter tibetensis]ALJ00594.1 hypothetical protein DC20_18470 [Rufibacter tibetensis]
MKKHFFLWLLVMGVLTSCGFTTPLNAQSKPVSHAAWDQQLKKYVAANGRVNYKAWKQDRAALQSYLKLLGDNAPNNKWSRVDQLAYWINAYNAFTVERILMDYPVKSIKDLGGKVTFVNTVWDQKFIKIGGKMYDLNNIEHNILRKKFEEPRIHFAIVCASESCPRLRNEAYVGSRINAQLEEQTVQFINDSTKNKISANQAELSEIFNWFGGDFKKKGTLLQFINKYSRTKVNPSAKISFMNYDWALNGI